MNYAEDGPLAATSGQVETKVESFAPAEGKIPQALEERVALLENHLLGTQLEPSYSLGCFLELLAAWCFPPLFPPHR